MGTRICANCKKELPLEEFEILNKKWKRSICKSCRNTEQNKSRSATPESYLKHLHSQLKYSRNSQNPEMKWTIGPEHLIELWEKQKGRCALSGHYMTHAKDGTGVHDFNVSIDRINPNLHYVPSNMQLVCHRVNIMKHNLTQDMFWHWCKNIVTTMDDL